MTKLDIIKNYINEYTQEEYESISTFDDLKNVGLMYSTFDDDDGNEHDIQVSADISDVENLRVMVYIDDITETNPTAVENVDIDFFKYLDFSGLYDYARIYRAEV